MGMLCPVLFDVFIFSKGKAGGYGCIGEDLGNS